MLAELRDAVNAHDTAAADAAFGQSLAIGTVGVDTELLRDARARPVRRCVRAHRALNRQNLRIGVSSKSEFRFVNRAKTLSFDCGKTMKNDILISRYFGLDNTQTT